MAEDRSNGTPENQPPIPAAVADALSAYPDDIRAQLLAVRGLIFAAAAERPEVGPLTETLKWGEPAYLTEASGSGSTIRLGRDRASGHAAVLFNCRTTLIDACRERYADRFGYVGNRAILLTAPVEEAADELSTCLAMALTYHRRAKP